MNRVSCYEALGKTLRNVDSEEKDVALFFFIFITVKEKEELSWDTKEVIERCLGWG